MTIGAVLCLWRSNDWEYTDKRRRREDNIYARYHEQISELHIRVYLIFTIISQGRNVNNQILHIKKLRHSSLNDLPKNIYLVHKVGKLQTRLV